MSLRRLLALRIDNRIITAVSIALDLVTLGVGLFFAVFSIIS